MVVRGQGRNRVKQALLAYLEIPGMPGSILLQLRKTLLRLKGLGNEPQKVNKIGQQNSQVFEIAIFDHS